MPWQLEWLDSGSSRFLYLLCSCLIVTQKDTWILLIRLRSSTVSYTFVLSDSTYHRNFIMVGHACNVFFCQALYSVSLLKVADFCSQNISHVEELMPVITTSVYV